MKLFFKNKTSLIRDGKTYSVLSSSAYHKRAYKLLMSGDEEGFIQLAAPLVERLIKEEEGFRREGGRMYFRNFEIKGTLHQKIVSLEKEGLPIAPFVNFCKRLALNPSRQAVLELFDFLSYRELPITEDGYFLAYKGLDANYWSVNGNTKTEVLQGEVDFKGKIKNSIGSIVEISRNSVCDDRNVHCTGDGLHAGSLEYAKNFGSKVVIVKIDPQHAVSVPNDCSFQKLRVCFYEVVSDFTEEIVAPFVKIENGEIKVPLKSEEEVQKERIKAYIARKVANGFVRVSVKSICSSFSPKKVKRGDVVKVAESLGYSVCDGVVNL